MKDFITTLQVCLLIGLTVIGAIYIDLLAYGYKVLGKTPNKIL